ncbi:hypothetical protein STXM2123_4879 [Streptomyces sp. F-3]|nr:hypothetical protein STXM2123_4879 [Streptomyces sp. F-3]
MPREPVRWRFTRTAPAVRAAVRVLPAVTDMRSERRSGR